MKDYLSYQLMSSFDVNAPLCSYAYITVNGNDWGLYLAVEAVEESFLQRNYGNDYGELYKPDSVKMGGGRGNGKNFKQEDFEIPEGFDIPKTFMPPDVSDEKMPDAYNQIPPDRQNGMFRNNGPGMMGSGDVSLVYTDDDYRRCYPLFCRP